MNPMSYVILSLFFSRVCGSALRCTPKSEVLRCGWKQQMRPTSGKKYLLLNIRRDAFAADTAPSVGRFPQPFAAIGSVHSYSQWALFVACVLFLYCHFWLERPAGRSCEEQTFARSTNNLQICYVPRLRPAGAKGMHSSSLLLGKTYRGRIAVRSVFVPSRPADTLSAGQRDG